MLILEGMECFKCTFWNLAIAYNILYYIFTNYKQDETCEKNCN